MIAPGIGGLVITEFAEAAGESDCALCSAETRLARVRRQGEHVWSWAECCPRCRVVVARVPCPDAEERGDARAWVAHLRTHGWTDADMDPIWLARARARGGA